MCLLDTIDGALMLSLYIQPAKNFLTPKRDPDNTSSADPFNEAEAVDTSQNHRDPVAFLYYSIVLTTLTVIVAIVIGVIQLLSLIQSAAELEGGFWDGVEIAGDYYDVIGGAICGCFVVVGLLSVVLYKPWKRRMDRIHGKHPAPVDDEERYRDDVDEPAVPEGESALGGTEVGKGVSTQVKPVPAESSGEVLSP